MIRFGVQFKDGQEINILEFVRFILNNDDKKGDVLLTLSKMERDKIFHFVEAALFGLGGRKRDKAKQK